MVCIRKITCFGGTHAPQSIPIRDVQKWAITSKRGKKMITNITSYTEEQRRTTNEEMSFADAIYWSNTVAYPICVRPHGVKMWFDFTRNRSQKGVLFKSYKEALGFFQRKYTGDGWQELEKVFAKCKKILPEHQQPV